MLLMHAQKKVDYASFAADGTTQAVTISRLKKGVACGVHDLKSHQCETNLNRITRPQDCFQPGDPDAWGGGGG